MTILAQARRLHPGVRGRVLPVVRWLIAGVLVAAWWVALAPTALGGSASYVLTQGESMLPTFEPGGLVITRASDSYQVGDVVAYRNRQLDSVVLHRIVAEDDGRFVLQGDNNDFLDGYRPSAADMVGKAWYELPGAGSIVRLVQEPLIFSLIIGATALLAVRVHAQPGTGTDSATAPGRTTQGGNGDMTDISSEGPGLGWRLRMLAVLAVIGIPALVLGLVGLFLPSHATDNRTLDYRQSGEFSYTAEAPADSVYGPDGLASGEGDRG